MNRRALAGAAMIVGASASIQIGGAVAHGLFDQLGPLGTSALRFALGATLLLVAVRPSLRRDAATWRAIAAYGLSLAALNVTFYQAIDRIPMGIAVTLAFVGPIVMALAGSRRRSDVAWALVGAAGVAMLGGIDRPQSLVGIALGLGTGAAWVAVAFAGRHVGRRTAGVDGLALALPVAALITVPLGIGRAADLDARTLGIGLALAAGGLILPFALELEGLRRLEPRVVAVVYSIDPGVAAIAGLLLLDEHLSGLQVVALVAVMAACAGAAMGAASDDDVAVPGDV